MPENLDGMDDDQLRAFSLANQNTPVGRYADLVIAARLLRSTGDITTALGIERGMQRIYDRLPSTKRW